MAFCVDLDCPGECRVGVVGRLTISRSVQWKGIRARRFRVGVKVRRELSRLASWRRGRNSTILKVKRESRDRCATTSPCYCCLRTLHYSVHNYGVSQEFMMALTMVRAAVRSTLRDATELCRRLLQ